MVKSRPIKKIPGQTDLGIPEIKKPWLNKGTFSDHYLNNRLKQSSFWPNNDDEIKGIYEYCRELWNSKLPGLVRNNEAYTRQELLDKVLAKLGYSFLPNTGLPGEKQEPDYILYSDENIKNEVAAKGKLAKYSQALTILEAKKVNHPLGQVSKKETPGRFPHQQIRDYLQNAQYNQGIAFFNWAILTNGNLWRLYCKSAKASDYFEFNFERALESFEEFKLFYALFRPESFFKDSENKCLLDSIRSEALQSQTELESDLRKRVFTILEKLANGFYGRKENNIADIELDLLYDNCLIFLYRLLFILYAESRGFLPINPSHTLGANKEYRERFSLQRFFSRLRSPKNYYSDDYTDFYEEILKLFHLIAAKKPEINRKCEVPLYNGGLFDAKEYPLIDRWKIGEKTLADILRKLIASNIPAGKGEQESFDFGEIIDYADLDVRQLGSIYEGLLENHLELESGQVVLRGDRTERKATGTYYTPDFIVDYIINNTVKNLCEDIEKAPNVKKALSAKKKDDSFAIEALKLKILDPAMGSGHFLVRATEYLAERVLNHPTTKIHTEKASGLNQENAERAHWRGRVVECCIFGVDLNPLAVELAKLSLWLTCISIDKPLNFLDHHLKTGNSLIGAYVDELEMLPRKQAEKKRGLVPLFLGPDHTKAISEAIKAVKKIEKTDSVDLKSIDEKKELLDREISKGLQPYRKIADIWTASFFGVKLRDEDYFEIANLISSNPNPKTKEGKKLNKRLQSLAKECPEAFKKRFFHWEMEFPEIFFWRAGIRKKATGFDVVLGNPPWVVTKPESHKNERKYFIYSYSSYQYQVDLYILFIEKAIRLTKIGGIVSMITPNSWLSNITNSQIRQFILRSSNIISLAKTPEKTFQDVVADCNIFVSKAIDKVDIKPIQICEIEKTGAISKLHELTYSQGEAAEGSPLLISNPAAKPILLKIESQSKLLKSICKITRGINPYDKYRGQSANIIASRAYHAHYKKDDTFLPELRGEDVQRYSIEWNGRHWISYGPWLAAPRDPMFHEGPRILFREILGKTLIGIVIVEKWLADRSLYIARFTESSQLKAHYVCGICNSRLMGYYARAKTDQYDKYFPKIRLDHFKKLPIKIIEFNTPSRILNSIVNECIEVINKFRQQKDYKPILAFIEKFIYGSPRRNDAAHHIIAHLVNEITLLYSSKRDVIFNFCDWLEREIIKGSIEDLKQKESIKGFYLNDLHSLLAALKRNKVLPNILSYGDKRFEALQAAFTENMTKIEPIKEQIAFTDNLIDQIVYRLYGLNEEQIELIEASH